MGVFKIRICHCCISFGESISFLGVESNRVRKHIKSTFGQAIFVSSTILPFKNDVMYIFFREVVSGIEARYPASSVEQWIVYWDHQVNSASFDANY